MNKKETALAALGLESNKSPAKKNERLAPTAFLPPSPPPEWREPLVSAKKVVSFKSVRVSERANVLRVSLRPDLQKDYNPSKVALFPNLGRVDVDDPDEERLRTLFVALAALPKLHWLELYGALKAPAEIGALRHLRDFTLRQPENKVDRGVHAVPSELGSLTELESLTIWGFPLEALPESMGKLTSLRACHLVDVAMKELPSAFSRMPALESLWMRTPSIDAAGLVATLGKSTSLRSLHLSCGFLAEVDSLHTLSRLVSISLTANLDTVPEDLVKLPELRFLHLDYNRLRCVPEALAEAPALETLSIHGNRELDIDQVVDVALRSKTLRGLCLPNAGPSPTAEKKLRAAEFRRAYSMTGDQWFRGGLLPSWPAIARGI